MQNLTDMELHNLAKKRVEFRAHLIVYCVIITIFWGIWYFTSRAYPWPIWPMAGWGIGLLFHYLFDYRPLQFLSEEDEYRKLKQKLEKHNQISS